ncbi:50S ribosomal protein L18 [candidate division KSB1 bacterium]|nr:50S ribosomal protein L18 [candidate division KSB1 bacterium]
MSVKVIDKKKTRMRKKLNIKKKVQGTPERPRFAVFRSLNHIYVQLIDDTNHRTVLTVSDLSKDITADLKGKKKTEIAKIVGKYAADKAKDLKIDNVVFDRAGYIYHGRVKALAEGAREGGLKF